MRLPSVKTLEQLGLSRETCRLVRDRMRDIIGDRGVIAYSRAEYLLGEIEELIESRGEESRFMTHGVESIPAGNGKDSPGIVYLNTGETYQRTILVVNGTSIRVGNWGSIVERGNYA